MELIQNRFKIVQFKSHSNYYENIWHQAWLIMASFIPNKDIYDIFFKLYADDIPEYAPMQSTDVINPKFFRNTIAGIFDIATKYIKETGTIQNLKNSPIFEKDLDYSGVYSWLNKIYKYYHAIAENITEIIPNQNGDFGCNILYVDKINYPELKKILNQFKDIKPSNNISVILADKNADISRFNLPEYDDEIGVCFSTNDFPENYSYEQFHKFIHEIGKSGEKTVFEYIQNDIINLGYSVLSKKDNFIVFNKNENTIQVNMPDTTNYHQSGWDICVTVYQNQEIIDFHYIEVKTHTENSIYSNSVKLSTSQMSMAFKNKEHYHVAFAVAEKKSTNIIKIKFYTNIPQLLADDSIKLNNSVNELIIIG